MIRKILCIMEDRQHMVVAAEHIDVLLTLRDFMRRFHY